MNEKKIYIIEDDIVILSGLEAKFSALGFEVLTSNGEISLKDVIHEIVREKVDFVILDLVLPGVDGFGLLKAIKEELSRVPVFVFSDFSENDVRERCGNLGADYYYLKQDFNTEEFAEKVYKIIQNRRKIKK